MDIIYICLGIVFWIKIIVEFIFEYEIEQAWWKRELEERNKPIGNNYEDED